MPMCVEGASLHLDNGLSLHKSHVQKRFVRAYYGKWPEGVGGGGVAQNLLLR